MSRGFIMTTFTAAVAGFGGWKLKEKYDGMVGAVKPNAITAKVSRLWDGIVSSLSSSEGDGDGEGRKMRQVDERVREMERRLGELERDNRNVPALVESILQARLDGQSYRHEFPSAAAATAAGGAPALIY